MHKLFCILCCALPLFLGVASGIEDGPNNQDDFIIYPSTVLNTHQQATDLGYLAETHEITTEDGYILQIYRIQSSNNVTQDKKPSVLLLHGLLDCSSGWVSSHPTKSLAYTLADKGYDVWLGNTRSNRFARKHVHMTIRDKEFWMFSWHEIGKFDLPAMIDHILEKTSQQKIHFVGHSQGGTSLFVMVSERPEYQKKLIAPVLLAPAVFMGHSRNLLFRAIAPFERDLKKLTDLIGLYEFKPSGKLMHGIAKTLCNDDAITQPLCRNVIYLMAGFGERGLNMSLVPIISEYDPAGAATMQFVHYAQLMNSGKFRQYDFGLKGNLKKYRSVLPPKYNLNNINIPIYVFYGSNDRLVDPKDIVHLHKVQPKVQIFLVPDKDFGHLDFIWGNKVDTLINNRVYSLIERHNH